MKLLIKKLISLTVKNNFFWKMFCATILRLTSYAETERKNYTQNVSSTIRRDAVKTIFPEFTVKHGIFKGLRYPKGVSSYGPTFPKLLGSYEKEIQPIFEEICKKDYTEILNIGCAEGYYAVGLAMRVPTATVYAYDIDERALSGCNEMAKLNNVGHRVITNSFCDKETLKSIDFRKKGFILSDCEGYEKELFTEEIASLLANYDLLIEIHDFININISLHIQQCFKETHEIEIIQSIDDIKKAQTYSYNELDAYDLASRKALLAERRPAIMEWFYLKSRQR